MPLAIYMLFNYIFTGLMQRSLAMAILPHLRNTHIRRSKSAHKLAACVLSDPEALLGMSAAVLAGRIGVSEPTVGRFCKSIGFKGFPDFKLQLAAELAQQRQRHRVAQNIESEDSSSEVINKIFEATRSSLDAAQDSLDHRVVEQAALALDEANKIVLYGLGASASVAQDAEHKLLRFLTPAIAVTDAINQRMISASLSEGDCVICISYSGRTILLEESARLARARGATIIGITRPGSPVAAQCDMVLGVESGEDTELYTPMTSRLAQLVVIDVLFTRLALLKGPDFTLHLRRIKKALASTRRAQ
jgi:RpiR family carbohydrate utilization transcriptional regulator